MFNLNKKRVVVLCSTLLLLFGSQIARAEFLGLLNGRLADVSRAPDFSIDFGIVLDSDANQFGLRGNYKLSRLLLVYADFSLFDGDGGLEGTPFGIGALYTVEDLLDNYDVGVKLSFHTGSFDLDTVFGSASVDISNLALEVIGSTKNGFAGNSKLDAYVNVGLQAIDADVAGDDLEFTFGGGVIYPVGVKSEVFGGIDFIDGAFLGGGYRLNF